MTTMKTQAAEVARPAIASYAKIIWLTVFAAALLLLPIRVAAQSATITHDGFISTNSNTQQLNFNGQGIVLVVAGQSATAGSAPVGLTKSYIKFELLSSLPPGTTAANVTKATLKLFISPSCNPAGAIDIFPITSAWTESTLNPSSPPAYDSTPANSSPIPVGKADTFLVIDLTELVQDWLESSSTSGSFQNNGIVLVASSSTTNVIFDSKESIVTSHEPRLEIVLANSGAQGPAGAAATVQAGSTTTLGPGGQAAVTNSGSSSAAVLNFSIPQGPPGANGQTGAVGAAATVQVGNTMTVPSGTPASVLNGGTQNAAVLNFLIPQGAPGATGGTGPKGDAGPVGINNRGAWNTANAYAVNDAVGDQGSFWLAVQAISANTPSSEPSSTNTSWQLLVAQGAQGPAGTSGTNGVNGAPGIAATVSVGSTATGAPGTSTQVTNSGTANAAILNFNIPQGATGAIGPKGDVGAIGINNKGNWNSGTTYNPSDSVFASGSYWLASSVNTNSPPAHGNANWQLLAAGINNLGAWSASTNYNPNDAVSDTGSFWLALAANSASQPSATNANWQLLAAQGANGADGAAGNDGAAGTPATVTVGSIATGLPGSPAQVTNTGTANATVLNFTIPQGPMGQQGPPGIVTAGEGVPVGALLPYAGSTAPPGWLLADGSAVSRAHYPALFAAIGTTYGAGDGATTFGLPDLRGRVPVAVGSNDTVSILGSSDGTSEPMRQPLHTHLVPPHSHGVGSLQVIGVGSLSAGFDYATDISLAPQPTCGSYGCSHTVSSFFQLTGNPFAGHFYFGTDGHTHGLTGRVGATTTAAADGDNPLPTLTAGPSFIVVNYLIRAQ